MLPLRPFQKTALSALNPTPPTQTAHVLCIAPTGSGKSLIYETAAKQPQRRTLLITPLVALARQQFKKLQDLGIPVTLGAGGSSEGPPPGESGAWVISPEILPFPSRKSSLTYWKPNLLVVDECHCLWEWGDHFRRSFALIPDLLREYSIHKSLWLTATLPFAAREKLRTLLPSPPIEIGEFDLPSKLHVYVQRVTWPERASALIQWITAADQRNAAGIIFVSTREATARVARLVSALGKTVVTYHGGLSSEERRNIENQVAQQIPEIIVATSAFGMGMDYPHLSYVVLWQAPTSLLSLVQTIGRVGRHATRTAKALILWDYEDFRLLEWTLQNSENRKAELERLLEYLKTDACRLKGLKAYFDPGAPQTLCRRCDQCEGRGMVAELT